MIARRALYASTAHFTFPMTARRMEPELAWVAAPARAAAEAGAVGEVGSPPAAANTVVEVSALPATEVEALRRVVV